MSWPIYRYAVFVIQDSNGHSNPEQQARVNESAAATHLGPRNPAPLPSPTTRRNKCGRRCTSCKSSIKLLASLRLHHMLIVVQTEKAGPLPSYHCFCSLPHTLPSAVTPRQFSTQPHQSSQLARHPEVVAVASLPWPAGMAVRVQLQTYCEGKDCAKSVDYSEQSTVPSVASGRLLRW
jgi:hypothetical protein